MKLQAFLRPPRRVTFVVQGLSLILLLLGAVGCGSTVYLVEVRHAERHFEEARELGAEAHAPYEYYSAKVRIDQAKRQAAIAEYGAAAKLSERADDFALQAIQKTKKSRSLARRAPAQRASTTSAKSASSESSLEKEGASSDSEPTPAKENRELGAGAASSGATGERP